MSKSVSIQPPRIYPSLRYRDPTRMVDWLVKAFGFSPHALHKAGDRVTHAQLALGSSMVMIGQAEDDAFGKLVGEPGENGGKSIYIAVDNVDVVHQQARKAGAEIIEGPVERDYGSLEFICRDPEGNIWSVGSYWPKAHEMASE